MIVEFSDDDAVSSSASSPESDGLIQSARSQRHSARSRRSSHSRRSSESVAEPKEAHRTAFVDYRDYIKGHNESVLEKIR